MRLRYAALIAVAAFVGLSTLVNAQQSATVPPLRIYDEGVILPLRYRLNMVGSAVTCVDDAAHAQSVCTFTGGGGGGGSGTVTSVNVSAPGSLLTSSGGPVTTSGTIALSLVNATANRVFAGPTSGGASAPTFRLLGVSDLPTSVVALSPTSVKTSNYTAANYEIVRCNPTGGGFAVTLPAATTSSFVVIKNQSNSTNTITITPGVGNTVDGASSFSLAASRASVTLYSDGVSDWMVN